MLSGFVQIEFKNIVGLANRNMLVPHYEKLQNFGVVSSEPEDNLTLAYPCFSEGCLIQVISCCQNWLVFLIELKFVSFNFQCFLLSADSVESKAVLIQPFSHVLLVKYNNLDYKNEFEVENVFFAHFLGSWIWLRLSNKNDNKIDN